MLQKTRRWRPWSLAHAQGKPKITGIERRLGRNTEMPRKTSKGKTERDETGWRTQTTVEERLHGVREGMPERYLAREENVRVFLACVRRKNSQNDGRIFAQRTTSREFWFFFSFLKCHRARTSHLLTHDLFHRFVHTQKNTFYLQVTNTCSKYLVSLHIRKFIVNSS